MGINELNIIGLQKAHMNAAAAYPGLIIARISAQYKDMYRVLTANSELNAEISGKLRFEASDAAHFPAVGDFVLVDRSNDSDGNAIIHHILPRKSLFERRAAGTGNSIQVIAANIDTVFICMSLNKDFNVRRLERYISLVWESQARPVVVLTKADLCPEVEMRVAQAHSAAIGVEILVTSSMADDGYASVLPYIASGHTIAFVGSSGVGKSTLINRLLGEEIMATGDIRGDDDKGRHITSHRQLFVLPGGAAVIDTPGMRELGLDSADLSRTFADIEEYGFHCRFQDCSHAQEPGCAVRQALEEGFLSVDRLESYQKLQKELKYEGLNSRQLEEEKIRSMFGGMGAMKEARKFAKNMNKRKSHY